MTAGPILIAAGGTGGHMFPAMALGRALAGQGRSVTLVTARKADRPLTQLAERARR